MLGILFGRLDGTGAWPRQSGPVRCQLGRCGLVTFYSYEQIKPYFESYFEKQLYTDVAAAAAVFVVSLVVLFWLCSLVWRAVRRSEFSGLDRSLGLLGGLFVGVFLVCIAYLGATWMWSEDDLLETIAKARGRPT